MDENTPPVTSVGNNHNNKNILGGSPVVSTVLKASTKDNLISQSPGNQNIKAPVHPSPKVPALTVISSRYDMHPDVEETEQWAERVGAITQNDHQDYIAFAAEVIHDILKSLPLLVETCRPEDSDDEIQFQPRSYTFDENADPFKSTGGLANSPVKAAETKSSTSPAKVVSKIDQDDSVLTSMIGSDNSEDPFKPSSQLQNSPDKDASRQPETDGKTEPLSENLDDVDPFKPKVQIPNSPADAQTATMNSLPENLEEIDPFKSNNKVGNSPVKSTTETVSEQENGVSSKVEDTLVQKSPAKVVVSETVAGAGLPESLDDVDPFKPKSQIMNSPCQNSTINSTLGTADLTVIENLPDNLDDIDPFKTKNQMQNSPVKKECTDSDAAKIEITGLPENLDDIDPFKPKNQMQNSPVRQEPNYKETEATGLPENQDKGLEPEVTGLLENLDDIDPFKPKTQMQNSPLKPASLENIEPMVTGLPENLDDIDPFKPNSQMQNSPEKATNLEVTKPKVTGLSENLEDIDPFKPKTQMQNSPIKPASLEDIASKVTGLPENLDDIDPFKPRTQMQNSPVKSASEEETKLKATELPENLDDIDPFKPKTQMQNSPVKSASEEETKLKATELPENLDDVDPFKPKTQMQNSPVKPASLKKTEPNVTGLPKNLDDIDPFKPRTQMQNSPIKPVSLENIEPNVTGLPESLDDIDPFKTKAQLQNSPAEPSGSGEKPLEVNGLPENLDDIDPFKTKSQVVNSPAVKTETVSGVEDLDAIEDPFKTKAQVQNSPDKVAAFESKDNSHQTGQSDLDFDNIDPFKTKSTVANPSAKALLIPETECADPFKTKSQIQNSPFKLSGEPAIGSAEGACFLDLDSIDPFKSNTTVQTYGKTDHIDPFEIQLGMANSIGKPTTEQLSVDPFDNLDAFNPFQGRMKTGNTPNKNNNALLQGLQNTPKMQSPGGFNLGNNLMCMIAPENKVEDNMNFSNDDFRPANEVFSDPNVWDMLEKFGSSSNDNAESDLARMSLYVKFDPLVDSKPADSPGAQHQTGVARGLQKMEVVRDGDESIMLMGTPPRGGGRRRSILVQRRPPTSVSKTIFEEESTEEKKPAKAHIVDLIFSCSPESENIPQKQEQKPQASPTLPEKNKKDETFFEVVEVLKYSETDVKRKLKKQRQELMLEFQGRQLSMEQELSKKQNALGTEAKHYKEKAEQLEIKNKEMRQVVVEYETFINELVTEKEKNTSESKESKTKLKNERDQAIEDLQSVEKSFADLHRRYEKVKAVLEDYRKNEETLKKTNQGLITKMQQQDEAMTKLKSQAECKLKQVREEKEKEKSSSAAEIIKLQAALKKSELHVQGVEKTLEQKVKENVELTDLCDTLIAKVGGS